jgi:large subunit ribosomal protein L1
MRSLPRAVFSHNTALSNAFIRRPLAPSISLATIQVRTAKKSASESPKAAQRQLAIQRHKNQLRLKKERDELRKANQLKVEARHAAQSPLFMDIDTALRYLRAAEVGRSPHATTIALNLRIVAEKGSTPIIGTCKLPKPLDEERIAVLTTDPAKAQEARDAGAHVVGSDKVLEDIRNGILNFDKAYATPEMMGRLAPLGRILGPKGLMPSAKRGTVTTEIYETIINAKGEMSFKQEGTILQLPVGRVNFTNYEIIRNIVAVTNVVRDLMMKANEKKPPIMGRCIITSGLGPAIYINV